MPAPLARIRSPRKAIWLSLVILFVFASACGRRAALLRSADDAKSKAEDLKSGGKDAVIATVFPDGRVYPKTILIRRGVHGIVWYAADGKALTLSSLTFPSRIICPENGNKGYCFANQVSATAQPGIHLYDGKTAGDTNVDPQIEIVN